MIFIFPKFYSLKKLNNEETLKKAIINNNEPLYKKCAYAQLQLSEKEDNKDLINTLKELINYSVEHKNFDICSDLYSRFIKSVKFLKIPINRDIYNNRQEMIAQILRDSYFKTNSQELFLKLKSVLCDEDVYYYRDQKEFKNEITDIFNKAIENKDKKVVASLLGSRAFGWMSKSFNYEELISPAILKAVKEKDYEMYNLIFNSLNIKANYYYKDLYITKKSAYDLAIANGDLEFFEKIDNKKVLNYSVEYNQCNKEEIYSFLNTAITNNQFEIYKKILEKNTDHMYKILIKTNIQVSCFFKRLLKNKEIFRETINVINNTYMRYGYNEEDDECFKDIYREMLIGSVLHEGELEDIKFLRKSISLSEINEDNLKKLIKKYYKNKKEMVSELIGKNKNFLPYLEQLELGFKIKRF
jgi:hypothetical protein